MVKSNRLILGAILTITVLVLGALVLSILFITSGCLSASGCANSPTQTTTKSATLSTSSPPICTIPYPSKIPSATPWKSVRLPNIVLPIQYQLQMNPHIEDGWFEGYEQIEIHIMQPTNFVYLHIDGLNISDTKLWKTGFPECPFPIHQQFNYIPNQFWVTVFSVTLQPGDYTMAMRFNGSLTKNIVGFYRSTYTNRNTGKQSLLVTTKFEPTFARRAFPCFDEPNKKAKYQINLFHNPAKYPTALSNTKSIGSYVAQTGAFKDGWYTAFGVTKPMSTYLVCFIICDFQQLNTTTQHGVLVRTFAPIDRIQETKYALQVASKTLDYYDDYFGIPYNQSFPKLDLVSIPDFISGAMENWGIITFRETRMLYMDGIYSANSKFLVTEVVCHELAHMWFGNLVTMDWWDDLWLNEGFATFIAYVKGITNMQPTYNSDSIFIVNELQTALELDSAPSSHPIIQNISKPSDINSAFDTITYSKGSSILRMLEDALTPSVFKHGITTYLRKYAYANARTDDLWQVLSRVSGKDVKSLMDTWTLQMAYPVLKYNSTSATLTQHRFASNPSASLPLIQWNIPIKYIGPGSTLNQSAIIMNSTTVQLPTAASNQPWVKFNPNSKGYYRVNYDPSTWNNLSVALRKDHTVLSASDRAELLDDSFKLAAAAQLNYGIPLNLISYMGSEDSFVPLKTTFSSLGYASTMLYNTNKIAYNKLQTYVGRLTSILLQKVGWSQSNVVDVNFENKQSYVLSAACSYGNSACSGNATSIFNDWLANPQLTKIPANYRSTVFKYGMRQVPSDQILSVWNTVFNRYMSASTADASKLRYCLAQTTNTTVLRTYLKLANNQSVIRDQDYWSFLRYISQNPYAGDMAFDWYNSNYQQLMGRFGIDDRYFGRAVVYTTGSFNTPAQLAKVQSFISANQPAGAGKQPRIQAVATIHQNIEWVQKNTASILNWLSKNT